MVKHSRNNTNASSFTYAERQMLGAGTKKERLGRDAMLNFDSCGLCLARAREPRACAEGHIFCQECIITNLLSQKKDIKRQTLLLERMKENEAETLANAKIAARNRVLTEFEAAQTGLSTSGTSSATSKIVASTSTSTEIATAGDSNGKKRKFDLDESEIERLALMGEEEAMRRTAIELAESRRAKLPNFWLPSLTPSSSTTDIIEVKLQTLCNVSKPHPCSLKSLLSINFEQDNTDSAPVGERPIICPVCRKSLSNNVKAFVLKPCGDVICSMCVETLCRKEKSCAHCNIDLGKKGGFIELKREGTGFASGGAAEASRFDLPFQG